MDKQVFEQGISYHVTNTTNILTWYRTEPTHEKYHTNVKAGIRKLRSDLSKPDTYSFLSWKSAVESGDISRMTQTDKPTLLYSRALLFSSPQPSEGVLQQEDGTLRSVGQAGI